MSSKQIAGTVLIFFIVMSAGKYPAQDVNDERRVPASLQHGLDVIDGRNLLSHVKVLASDEFEGRAPGTRGEDLTVKYLTEQFKAAGAAPGNPNGTYIQRVPLVGYRTTPKIEVEVNGNSIPFAFYEDFVHDYPRLTPQVSVNSAKIVFAGFGITAPQYGWNDYKNIDVKNKLVIVLSGEPSRSIKGNQDKLDSEFFKGSFRTYYSTRESKYEEAAKRGAAGVLVIYDSEKARTFSLYQTFARTEGQNLKPAVNHYAPAIAGLVTTKATKRIFAAENKDFDSIVEAASRSDFRPLALDASAAITITSKLRSITSRNVVAKVVGSDPRMRNEYVIYTAHWDALGKDESLKGDQIYNGANDNAIGTGQLIEVARAFAALKRKPRRSILFIATTAEEKGFLGAKYYAQRPLYPISATVANINLDAGNFFGLTRDLDSAGYGNSTIDDILDTAARMQGRVFLKGSVDETGGYYFASDQIEFAKVGIPAAFPWSADDYVGKAAGYGEKVWDDYGAQRYHKVTDEVMPSWDTTGAVEDSRWFAIAGYLIANGRERPQWHPTSEFARIRSRL
jgi:Zn-dependent M28 family amino/carboxypeptidase